MSSCNSCGSMRYSCSCKQSSFSTYYPSNKYFYNKKEIDNMLKGLSGSGGNGGSIVVKHYVPYGTTELFKTLDQAKASVTALNGDYLITYDVDNTKGQLWLRIANKWELVNNNAGNVVMADYVLKADNDWNDLPFTVQGDTVILTTPITLKTKEVQHFTIKTETQLPNDIARENDIDIKIVELTTTPVSKEQSYDSGVALMVEPQITTNSLSGFKLGMGTDGAKYEDEFTYSPDSIIKIIYKKEEIK